MKDTVFCILAGGKSERFNTDKRFVKLKDKPLIDYILNTIKMFQKAKIVISTKKGEKLSIDDTISIEDKNPFEGPVCGIYRILNDIPSEKFIFFAADMPFISKEMIEKLIDCINSNCFSCLFSSNDKLYPLPFAIKKEAIDFFKTNECKNRRIKELLFFRKPCIINWHKEENLFNINRQKDLSKAKELMDKLYLDF